MELVRPEQTEKGPESIANAVMQAGAKLYEEVRDVFTSSANDRGTVTGTENSNKQIGNSLDRGTVKAQTQDDPGYLSISPLDSIWK